MPVVLPGSVRNLQLFETVTSRLLRALSNVRDQLVANKLGEACDHSVLSSLFPFICSLHFCASFLPFGPNDPDHLMMMNSYEQNVYILNKDRLLFLVHELQLLFTSPPIHHGSCQKLIMSQFVDERSR